MTELEELSAEEGRLEWDTPLFRTAMTQFEQAIPYAEVNESIAERLRYPERAVMVTVPIRRDEGHVDVFPAYRVQHSSVLGPTKGGVRYDADWGASDPPWVTPTVIMIDNGRESGDFGYKTGIRDLTNIAPRVSRCRATWSGA